MPLPNNATVRDVINKLEELQGVNQKSELSSVIGSPTTSNDPIANQIVILSDAKDLLADNLNIKNVPADNSESIISLAEKVGQIISGGMQYKTGSQSRSSNYSFVIPNVPFNPTHLFIFLPAGGTNYFVKTPDLNISVNGSTTGAIVTSYVNSVFTITPDAPFSSSGQYRYYLLG